MEPRTSAPLKILIVTYHMVPFAPNWGSGQRMYFLAEHLQQRGHDVHVISAKLDHYGNFGHEPSFTQHLRPIDSAWYRRYLAGPGEGDDRQAAPRMQGAVHLESPRSAIRPPGQFLARAMKQTIKKAALVYFGGIYPVMELKAWLWQRGLREYLEQLLSQEPFDVAVVSAPPFAVFGTLRTMKRTRPELPVVMDYRDPWSLACSRFGPYRSREVRCLRQAAVAVGFSDVFAGDLAEKLHIHRDKLKTVWNGYSDADWTRVLRETGPEPRANNSAKLVIAHVGSISVGEGFRDAQRFVRAFEQIASTGDVLLRFVGELPPATAHFLKSRLGGNVEMTGMLSHEQSLRQMRNSDVLVLVHTARDASDRFVVTGKFFDYMKSGQVILGIGSPEVGFNRMIQKYGLGLVSEDREEDIGKCLRKIHERWTRGQLSSLREQPGFRIEEFSREYQNGQYARMLESLAGRGP